MSTRRPRTKAAPQKPASFVELGTTGLQVTGGRVFEEFLPALQGPRALAVYREMSSNDPTVGAMLRAIEMLIRRVEWRIEPASDAARDVEVADFVQSCLDDMADTWADTLANILSFVRYGFSVHEEVYKRRQGPSSDPRKHSAHDDGRIGWSRLAPRAQSTIDQWLLDDEGWLLGCVQKAPPDYRDRPLPWGRILLFRATAEKGNPEGQSVLRSAYRAWYYKKRIEEIEGVGVERDLAGLPTALVPPQLLAPDAPDAMKTQLRQIELMLRNIRRDQREGIVFPLAYDEGGKPLYELKLLSTGGRRQFDTTGIIGRWDNRIAMSVLADFVLLGHEKVGSFALASSKTDLFAVALGAWLDVVTEQFNRFAIPRLLAVNTFAVAEGELPQLTHGDIETVDLNELSTYVSTLVGAGVVVPTPALERHLLQNAGLPEPEAGEGLEAKQEQEAEMAAAAQAAMEAGGGVPPGTPGVPPGAGRPPAGTGVEKARAGRFPAAAPTTLKELRAAWRAQPLAKWDPDQPRGEDGRWGSGGSGGSGSRAAPAEVARMSRVLERRVRDVQRAQREAFTQGAPHDPARAAQQGAELREMRRQLALAQGADPEVAVGTRFRVGTGKVDWVVTALEPAADERALGRFVVSARSADGTQTRATTWENEIRVQPRDPVAKFDPDQPRDDDGRWAGGAGGADDADEGDDDFESGPPTQQELDRTERAEAYESERARRAADLDEYVARRAQAFQEEEAERLKLHAEDEARYVAWQGAPTDALDARHRAELDPIERSFRERKAALDGAEARDVDRVDLEHARTTHALYEDVERQMFDRSETLHAQWNTERDALDARQERVLAPLEAEFNRPDLSDARAAQLEARIETLDARHQAKVDALDERYSDRLSQLADARERLLERIDERQERSESAARASIEDRYQDLRQALDDEYGVVVTPIEERHEEEREREASA